jgi:RNA polymerase sigma-70 factor (ECF subfamily)
MDAPNLKIETWGTRQEALGEELSGSRNQCGKSCVHHSMQLVGTLSWSMVGLAAPPKPARRSIDPPGPGGSQGGTKQPGTAAVPASGAPHAVGEGARRFARGEVRPLEIDWSQIVGRCMDGDSGAWAELVREHHRRVYGLCYRFTGSAADAEDLTQDVFLKIYSNLASFDTGRGSLQVWITTMTRNLLVDNFRRTKNQRVTSSLDEGWDQTEEMKPVDRLTAKSPSPHEMAAKKELEKMVQNALSHVSVELREAVILRDLQDMDYKEIAQVLGIPEGTVKSRISRGRAELARLLERNKREVM